MKENHVVKLEKIRVVNFGNVIDEFEVCRCPECGKVLCYEWNERFCGRCGTVLFWDDIPSEYK